MFLGSLRAGLSSDHELCPRDSCEASSQNPHFTGERNVAHRWAVTHLRSHSLLTAQVREETGSPEFHLDSFHIPLNTSLLEVMPDYHLIVHQESAVSEPVW